MRIGIVGTRGIPSKYGGFETFAEELSIRLVPKGINCTVYCDKDSYNKNNFKGVNLSYINTTKTRSPLKYYFKSLKEALKTNNIILITGCSGALFFWLKYFYNKKAIIITNIDGIEHKRAKWPFLIRKFIRFGEWVAINFSTYVISDSKGIKKYINTNYPKITNKKIKIIEYGAYPCISNKKELIKEFNVLPNNYYLIVARLEPENNIHVILKGYYQSKTKIPLVVVGNLLNNNYVQNLLKYKSDNIKFVNGIYNKDKLLALRSYCKAYFHGHSVGGTNPSLLEAMGASNFIIAHDNSFNRDVTNNNSLYFKNANDCTIKINEFEKIKLDEKNKIKDFNLRRIKTYYNWDLISNKYIDFFNNI